MAFETTQQSKSIKELLAFYIGYLECLNDINPPLTEQQRKDLAFVSTTIHYHNNSRFETEVLALYKADKISRELALKVLHNF